MADLIERLLAIIREGHSAHNDNLWLQFERKSARFIRDNGEALAAALRALDEEIARLRERERLYLSEACSLKPDGNGGFIHACQAAEARVRELEAYIAAMTGQGS